MATLTKAKIVEDLFAKNLLTKGEAARIIETMFELIKQTLEQDEDVLITGFGRFCVQNKNQRRGRGIPKQASQCCWLPTGWSRSSALVR